MGMYTELVIKSDIVNNLPKEVDDVLKYLFSDEMEDPPENLPDHPFFKCPRWQAIGRSNSYYHIPCSLSYYKEGYLFSRSDLKDYDGEIESFLDWINPFLDCPEGFFIGWEWYEEWENPKFIRKK